MVKTRIYVLAILASVSYLNPLSGFAAGKPSSKRVNIADVFQVEVAIKQGNIEKAYQLYCYKKVPGQIKKKGSKFCGFHF